MSRKVQLLCYFVLALASFIGAEYTPPTAVSYSSISFGEPTIEKNSENKNLKTHDETQLTFYSTLDTSTAHFKKPDTGVNAAPLYTEAIFPRYVPSGARVLNLARPLPISRNIPAEPSPEFATAPSILMTPGLSAYASSPLEISVPEMYLAPPVKTKGLSGYVSSSGAQVLDHSEEQAKSAYYSMKSEVLTSSSLGFSNEAHKIDYSESPAVSHVAVSSSATNYSW